MSKAKGAEGASDLNSNLPFEEAVKRLESIVESMEAEDLPLEALLSKYEEGTRLTLHCQGKLEEAELKIQRLEKNSKDGLGLKPISLEDASSGEKEN